MGVTSGAALVRDLSFAEASAILRQIEPGIRNQLLEELPRRLRRDFEMSLAFPTDTVGAHMTTAIATLSEDAKTADALELIKQMERDHTDVILVLNDKHKLVGAVTVTSLLRHPTHIPLVDQLDTSCVTLSAYARLDAVAGLDAWDDYNQLPVVSRRGEVIGTVSRKAVTRSHLREHASDSRAPSLVESMVDAFAASAAGLAELLTWTSGAMPGPGDSDEH
jgi:magnesium transporter